MASEEEELSNPIIPSECGILGQVQDSITNALSTNQQLSAMGVTFIAEHERDIEFEIKQALGKQGIVGIVSTPSATYGGHDGETQTWQLGCEVDIYENPTVRRAEMKYSELEHGTASDIASYVSDVLCAPNTPYHGMLVPNGIEVGEDNGIVVARAAFDTYALTDGQNWQLRYLTELDLSAINAYIATKITNPEQKQEGQVLTYDGQEWIAQDPQGGGNGSSAVPKQLPEYLYAFETNDDFEEYGKQWRKDNLIPQDAIGGCSSARNGNLVGRNYDWQYSDAAEFIVSLPHREVGGKTKYASIGIASLGSHLTRKMVQKGEYTELYKAVPSMMLDGINEKGLSIAIHICHSDETKDQGWDADPTNPSNMDVFGIVRKVLDKHSDIEDAAEWIEDHAYLLDGFSEATRYSVMFILHQNGRNSWIVQDGKAYEFQGQIGALTNFRIYDDNGLAHYTRQEVGQYDPYGQGIERMAIINHLLQNTHTQDAMKSLMDDLKFTTAYQEDSDWLTEFTDAENGRSMLSDDSEFVKPMAIGRLAYETRDRNHPSEVEYEGQTYEVTTWQTVHSCVYDLDAKTMTIRVQEGNDDYTFRCNEQYVPKSEFTPVKNKADLAVTYRNDERMQIDLGDGDINNTVSINLPDPKIAPGNSRIRFRNGQNYISRKGMTLGMPDNDETQEQFGDFNAQIGSVHGNQYIGIGSGIYIHSSPVQGETKVFMDDDRIFVTTPRDTQEGQTIAAVKVYDEPQLRSANKQTSPKLQSRDEPRFHYEWVAQDLPSKTSDLINDSGFITREDIPESDPHRITSEDGTGYVEGNAVYHYKQGLPRKITVIENGVETVCDKSSTTMINQWMSSPRHYKVTFPIQIPGAGTSGTWTLYIWDSPDSSDERVYTKEGDMYDDEVVFDEGISIKPIFTWMTEPLALQSSVQMQSAELRSEIPTKVSQLENDVPYALSSEVAVQFQDVNLAIDGLADGYSSINEKIPTQASRTNQLADKAFVNSSIATNTGTFKGTFNSTSELPSTDVHNNDYAFVVDSDSSGNTVYKRYKYNGSDWQYEYQLNNSSFTAQQWATINGGPYASPSDIPTKVSELENDEGYLTEDDIPDAYTKAETDALLADKADSDDVAILRIW